MTSDQQRYFNLQLRLCRKEEACFTEKKESTKTVDIYLSSLLENANNALEPNPIQMGEGIYKETKTLPKTKVTLTWNNAGFWEHKTSTRYIQILPNTAQKDVEEWIKAFSPIDKKILSRGIAGKEPIIILVGNRFNLEHTVPGYCTPSREIGFPTAKDQKSLLGCALARSSQFQLQDLILHEIAHLLEPQFRNQLTTLSQSLIDNQTEKVENTLKKVSPHYLGAENQTKEDLQTLQKMLEYKETTVQHLGRKRKIKDVINDISQSYAHEILAECIRHFYLSPIIHKNPVPPTTSGWEALDTLTGFLTKEANRTPNKELLNTEPFPII